MLPVQLPEWNRTELDYPRSSTLADLFAQQAALSPTAVAVIAKDRQLSYRELDERSNQMARHLQTLGVEPETLVGIAVERSEALAIGVLAILKAGGAYVPLDTTHPKERLAMVIQDSGMAVLLTSIGTRARLPSGLAQLTLVDLDDPVIAALELRAVRSTAASDNLAYVIYTSGSTGKPKGVMVEHRNVVNCFAGMDQVIAQKPGVWLAVTSVAFDISVLELLWTLTRGFTVVIHGDEGTSTIADEISRLNVTHIQMTPSLARMLSLDARALSAFRSLRQMLLGGEVLPASLIHRLRKTNGGDIVNMYGPTETTIWSTTYRIEETGSTIPIGRPIANTQVYLLDANLQQVTTGDRGELFIGGDGVARGYLNRNDLTAQRFLNLPAISAHRIYRTGDMARLLSSGDLEFLGRADDQIKIRGHRIEPGEIEAVLEECPGVMQAVVVAREDREGDKRLVAYLVGELAGPEPSIALRSALRLKLTDAMVPSAFVFLSALPLTQNGKIDRSALLKLAPPPFAAASTVSRPESCSSNEIEQIVSKVWQEALGISQVRLHDNFFDLGAHSVMIAEVHAQLQVSLNRDIPLVDLFQFSTVSSLARHLAGTETDVRATQISDRAHRRRLARQS